jgi:hypothetical protein
MTSLHARRANEERIIKRVIADALASDPTLQLSVDEERPTRDPDSLYAEIVAVDEARLYFHPKGRAPAGGGWVFFVLGNDQGETVISDYTANLEGVLAGAMKVVAEIERKLG